MRAWLLAGWALATGALAAPGDTTLIDDFRDASRWQASASDQVSSVLRRDAGGTLCLDYDFRGVSGYAVARRTLDLALPETYEFRLRLHGQGPANHFQFKLTDASGDNVWWLNQPDTRFAPEPRELRIRQRQIQFAWGPTADKRLRRPQALELVVASGSGGGRGSVCFERLVLVERAPVPAQWPQPRATTAPQGIDIDLGLTREFSGIQLRWPVRPAPGQRPSDYALESDDGGGQWQPLVQVHRAAGPLDALYLPDAEARRIRLKPLAPGAGREPLALPAVTLVDASAWRSPDDATAARAKALPRGAFPRAYLGEQNYWTLFGVDRGARASALLSEDGAVEPAPGQPAVEPFVLLEEGRGRKTSTRLVSWADVTISHHLPDGYLPQPRVRWTHPAFTLDIEAGASGEAPLATGLARYTLRATGPQTPQSRQKLKATLLLVTRPWQVNPPQQFLNRPGGASLIRTLRWQGGALSVNDLGPPVQALPAPALVVAGGGADWPLAMALARGDKGLPLPEDTPLASPDGRGEAALVYPLSLAPGGEARVALAWPMSTTGSTGGYAPPTTLAEVDAAFEASAQAWRSRLNRVGLQLPAEGQRVHDTLRSALAQILLSRDGPALQPGTRSYARAWVRDGAMMVAGLLRLGEVQAAEEFVDWYQTKLFDNGKVPCCVDARGADPVPENDSHGQFIYAVAELWRFTKGRAALARRWPAVERATRYMETLRQSTRTEANRAPGREAFFGLMPASISHEGYSEKPMHSYWDDFWALRGYKDAVQLAEAMGHTRDAEQFTAWRDEFAHELAASIRTAVTARDIAYVPGAAELGDFDPTSTTVALNPAQAQGLLPPGLLQATFERYWHESQTRARGERKWVDYTPYELRSVGALVRLGKPARALAMLDFFFADQRPAGWNQWAEVVMRGYREPRFLGDMPHAWVASDAIRSLLDLFAHEEGEALVLGAGLPEAWLAGAGVALRGLPTPGGPLSYRMKRTAGGLQVDIDAGPQPPPGGFKVRWHGREQRIERLPASITLED